MLEKKLILNGRKNPKKIIFIYDNKKITYSEFLNYVFYFSKSLKKKLKETLKFYLSKKILLNGQFIIFQLGLLD